MYVTLNTLNGVVTTQSCSLTHNHPLVEGVWVNFLLLGHNSLGSSEKESNLSLPQTKNHYFQQ